MGQKLTILGIDHKEPPVEQERRTLADQSQPGPLDDGRELRIIDGNR